MIAPLEVIDTEARAAAVVRVTTPRAEVERAIDPAIGEVLAALAAQGVTPAGPMFARHHRVDPAAFDFDVGFPVAAPIAPTGRVVNATLPAARAARTVYTGPYEGLGAAWGAFMAALRAQGLVPAAGAWEVYAAGPESTDDPARYRTELYRAVTG